MKAVLVIDMLEDFFEDGHLKTARGELVRNINTLTEQAREKGTPVIWVRQEFKEDLSDAFLIMRKENISITIAGTKGSRILSELKRDPEDQEVVKKRYSAFFGTELDALLSGLGANELIMAGVNTHACVRTAAIDAYQRDLEVTIPVECVASNDPDHHDVTLEYLDGHIAVIVPLEEVWGS